ncbi:ABC transporter permease [Corynebacterium sp. H113]|uniref:ABC transporter permease n=1 Tax=Corynebacterium sp. H113 TaxID=3133419 RepID=UPI00309CF194
MNLSLSLHTAKRVFLQLRSDRRTMALILGVPTMLLVLLYFVYDNNPQLFNRVAVMMLGVLPLMLMFIITSVTMQRERAGGTLERLWTTRLHRADLLTGYAIAFGFMAVLQSVVLVLVMDLFLGVETASTSWIFLLLAAVTGVTGVALGLLGSAFARTEFQAVQLMPVVIGPQIFLCGLLAPREQLPDVLRWFSNVLPLSYAVDAANGFSLEGITSSSLGDVAIVAIFALAFLAVASATMPRTTR